MREHYSTSVERNGIAFTALTFINLITLEFSFSGKYTIKFVIPHKSDNIRQIMGKQPLSLCECAVQSQF